MPIFSYKTLQENGEAREGRVEAESREVLQADFEAKGEQVVFIDEYKQSALTKKIKDSFEGFLGTVKEQEKIIFAKNLAAMIKAGLPLSRALSVMERQLRNKAFKKILADIQSRISKGESFHETLAKYPAVFSKLFVSMVAAGEESGKLIESLETVSLQMDRMHTIKKKVKGAMIYPAVILSLIVALGILMLVFIVPTLTNTFAELNVELPLSTRIVIGISDVFRENGLIVGLVVILLGSGLYYGIKTRIGKKILDTILLKMPLISGLVKEINAARTARTLSSLLSSGVDYVVAVQITEDVVQNSYYKNVIREAGKSVEKGEPISKTFLAHQKLYPTFVGEMASVGEETGDIAGTLKNVADFYEEDVQEKTKNMSTLVEPFLMIIIGAAVGFFAIAMLTPTFSLVDAI